MFVEVERRELPIYAADWVETRRPSGEKMCGENKMESDMMKSSRWKAES